MPSPMNKIYAFLSFVFGVGIMYVLITLSKVENILSLLLRIDVTTFLLVILTTLLIALCATTRWTILIRSFPHQQHASFLDYLGMFFIGRMGSFFLPKEVSDIGVRTALLMQKNMTTHAAFFSTILDRLSDVLIIFLFLIPGSLYLTNVLSLGTALLLLAMFFLSSISLIFLFPSQLKHLLMKCIWFWKKTKEEMPLQEAFFTSSLLSTLFFLSVLRFFFVILRVYLLGHIYGLSFSLPVFVLITPVAQLGYLVSLTPGGLGFLEATWYGVLTYLQMGEAEKISFVLGQRFITFIAVLFCFLCVAVIKRWRR